MNFEKRKTPMLLKLTPLGYPTVMVQSSHKLYMHTHYPWIASWDFWMITLDHHMAILGL